MEKSITDTALAQFCLINMKFGHQFKICLRLNLLFRKYGTKHHHTLLYTSLILFQKHELWTQIKELEIKSCP